MKEEAHGWSTGVDGVGDVPEMDTLLVQLAEQVDLLFDRPAQSVDFPNDQGIDLAQHCERCLFRLD